MTLEDPPIKHHRARDGAVYIDPLYGHVPIRPALLELIDLPSFQRLRRIKQLATIYLTLPGATHTRFEHSIGTYYLATRACQALQEKIADRRSQPGRHGEPDQVPPLPGPDHLLALQVAALLHDIGHGPFCHVFDMFLELSTTGGPASHDFVTRDIILGKVPGFEDVSDYLDRLYAERGGNPILMKENIASLALGHTPMHKMDGTNFRFLAEIVSSSWGVDRLDYLRRDSYHTGIETGRLDIWTIIDSYTTRRAVARDSKGEILENVKGEQYDAWNLGLEMRAAPWLEAMLDTRDQCYRLLYFSKSNRIAVSMLLRAIERAHRDSAGRVKPTEVEPLWRKLWQKDDAELMEWLCNSPELHDPLPRSLALRVRERRLYETLPVEIVSAGSVGAVEDDESTREKPHDLICELEFGTKELARLEVPPENVVELFDIEHDTARELDSIPEDETIIFDIHMPPFEHPSTFTTPVLQDRQRDQFFSLIQVLPHLRTTRITTRVPGGAVSPHDAHARFLNRVRVYIPPGMISAAIALVFFRVGDKHLSPDEATKLCVDELGPALKTIVKKFASSLKVDEKGRKRLLSKLRANMERDIEMLLDSPVLRLHIAQLLTTQAEGLSEDKKKRISKVIRDLVRERRDATRSAETGKRLKELAAKGGSALVGAIRELIVDYLSEITYKLLGGPPR